jgi:CubicO group peptidase (beta-lactamase class C family)
VDGLEEAVDALAARSSFSGVVRVDRSGRVALEKAYGMADRAHLVANTVGTRFATASATKGLTALTIVSLVEGGMLTLATAARPILGDDLPLIATDVTIEHLLAHRSGIGDYLDEEAGLDLTDYLMSVPVHELVTTEDYLRVLDGHPTAFAPDTRFAYNNGAYVVLALIAERVSGTAFHELVRQRVCEPAGMRATAFLRSDELPGDAAVGYLWTDRPRTNVFHLPVRGSGDGGAYAPVGDVHRLWRAFFDGRIVSRPWVEEMVRPRSVDPRDGSRYGLGFWIDRSRDVAILEGADAGVSCRSVHDPAADATCTVLSNTTEGAWDVAELLEATSLPERPDRGGT